MDPKDKYNVLEFLIKELIEIKGRRKSKDIPNSSSSDSTPVKKS